MLQYLPRAFRLMSVYFQRNYMLFLNDDVDGSKGSRTFVEW